MARRLKVRQALMASSLGMGLLLTGCGSEGEDRPNVDVIGGGGGTGSISGEEPAVTLGAGYTPSTNQDANLAIGLDLKDLRALMSSAARNQPVDWAAVTALYEGGKNQSADGATRSLASLATGEANAIFANGATVYGRANIIDGILRDGLTGQGRAAGLTDNGRRQLVDKGVQMLMYALGHQHLNAAVAAQPTSPVNAAAAIDAAWASMTGTADPNGTQNNGLIATGVTREEDFQLLGKVSPPLQVSLADALYSAQRQNKENFTAAVASARGYSNAIFYLSTLRNAKLLATDATAANRELHLAEGWTYWQTIRAAVAEVNPAGAQLIESAFMRAPADEFPADAADQIFAALNDPAVLQKLGIPEDIRVTSR